MDSGISNGASTINRPDMNRRLPGVTVLMPVFNGERYLGEAIESMLNQMFTDFEFLVIDDGSTDRSVEIVRSYHDPRIRLVQNEVRTGLTASLNQGIASACGEYIARMDCDDISLPQRLERQAQFLDRNPDIGVLGTDVEIIDELGMPRLDSKLPALPTLPGIVRWTLFFWCCVYHPTVMVRRTIYQRLGGYSLAFPHAEDYELWLRASLDTQIANLPDVLLRLRKHLGGLARTHTEAMRRYAEIAVRNALSANLGREVPLERVRDLQQPYSVRSPEDAVETAALVYDLQRLCITAGNVSLLERNQIRDDAAGLLGILAIACARKNPPVSLRIWRWCILLRPFQPLRMLVAICLRRLRSLARRLAPVKEGKK